MAISTRVPSISSRRSASVDPPRFPRPMPTLTEGAIFDALRNVQEPELGRDIVTLNMVKEIAIDGADVAFTIELTTPACPLKDEIERNVNVALREIGVEKIAVTWGAMVRRATPQQPQQLLPGVKNVIAVASGQGRRRQEHDQRQPRRFARPVRRGGRTARRGHHRPEHPDDARRRGPAGREREQQDHAARASRREVHLDPVLRPRGPADRLAGTARRRGDPAVPARRGVGRARLPRHRPAARNVRCPADARPGGTARWRGSRDDAAGSLAVGRHQGPRDVQAPVASRSSASSRT